MAADDVHGVGAGQKAEGKNRYGGGKRHGLGSA